MKRRTVSALTAFAASLLLMSTALAGTITPDPVKTTGKDEFGGSGNANYFAWTRFTSDGYRIRVDPPVGSIYQIDQRAAFSGQMDPDSTGVLLPYYRFTRTGETNLRLFDLATQMHQPLPAGINTGQNEYDPAVSGDQLTFVRFSPTASTLFLVTDLTTGDKVAVKSLGFRRNFVSPPRFNGDWITYSVCGRRTCNSYRYSVSGATTAKVPNPNGVPTYASSVDPAGNVYLTRSGFGCGQRVRVMKWTGSGNPTFVYRFPRGQDVRGTSAYDDGTGAITVFVDLGDCDTLKFDIYSFTNP